MEVKKIIDKYTNEYSLNNKQVELLTKGSKRIHILNFSVLNNKYNFKYNKKDFKLHRCFQNAWDFSKNNKDVDYVEGFIKIHGSYGFSQYAHHAWNVINNDHFDITPIKKFEPNFGYITLPPSHYLMIHIFKYGWISNNLEKYDKYAGSSIGLLTLKEKEIL